MLKCSFTWKRYFQRCLELLLSGKYYSVFHSDQFWWLFNPCWPYLIELLNEIIVNYYCGESFAVDGENVGFITQSIVWSQKENLRVSNIIFIDIDWLNWVLLNRIAIGNSIHRYSALAWVLVATYETPKLLTHQRWRINSTHSLCVSEYFIQSFFGLVHLDGFCTYIFQDERVWQTSEIFNMILDIAREPWILDEPVIWHSKCHGNFQNWNWKTQIIHDVANIILIYSYSAQTI